MKYLRRRQKPTFDLRSGDVPRSRELYELIYVDDLGVKKMFQVRAASRFSADDLTRRKMRKLWPDGEYKHLPRLFEVFVYSAAENNLKKQIYANTELAEQLLNN